MGDRRGIRSGSFFRSVEPLQAVTLYLVDGQVATDGIQRSSVATVGTTNLQTFLANVDPGYDMKLANLELFLKARFDNIPSTSVGTAIAYWEAKMSSKDAPSHDWIALTATHVFGVPTNNVAGDPHDMTVSGLFPVATLVEAPFDVRLMVNSLADAQFHVSVDAQSYVSMVGAVIPGT